MKRFPFRRFLSRLAVLCLLGSLAACGAGAEAAGSGVEKLALTGGGAIYRYTAPDGQEIYLVADERQEPVLHREDVNFDGVEDVVALTRLGASNAFYDFFVWDGRQYVYATPPGRRPGWPTTGWMRTGVMYGLRPTTAWRGWNASTACTAGRERS